jgi:predicted dienelactone hydrolase
MKFLFSLLTICLLVSATSFAADPSFAADTSNRVGVRMIELPSSSRGTDLKVMVWYPAQAGGTPVRVGEDRLFRGTEALKDAPPADGAFPLILVSHGSGGGIANLDWIATRLAASGFVVAGPNHSGTTRGNSTPIDTTKIWQRPADLSDVLTVLKSDPFWGPHIDAGRIGAFGFSLGGHTVLALAGGRVDREAYARYCDLNRTMPDCVWFASGNVDLRQTDKPLFERSNLDPRFKSVVAIDPSVAQAFTAESLRAISIPVHIINIGSPGTIPVAVRFDKLAAEIPDADYQTVDGAVHLSFLAECQPDARTFLKSVGETDPLCDDAAGNPRSREAIHTQFAAMIEAAFLHDLARR